MSSELVAVELQLRGYEGVMSDMRALDRMLNGFRGKKNKIEIQADLSNAKKEMLALKGALTEFQEQQAQVPKGGTAWNILQGYIEETNAKMKDCRQRTNELDYALKNLSPKTWGDAFKKISSQVAHLGSAMQSAGNALTHLTSPFARFTSGMVMGAGYKALNKFTEGLESGFARADTMRKYTRLMAEYETKNYTAEKSVKALDDSVQGLPIALDDAVGLAQRYTLSLGDMERGTNLAIATNNAFLASMATENQRYQGMLQMQDLLNGKDLNSREWMSLGASMGKAINEVGKEFGYTNENMGEFRQELYAGNIATEDFLNALEKVGTGEGSLVKLAQESANTWEAFFSRIGTASSRMVYGILTSMDELVNSMSGGKFTTLNALFDDYLIGNIDKMTASIKGWISAHPQEIVEFGKALKSIKWGSIIKGVGEAYLRVADFVVKLGDIFGGKNLAWIGKFMVYGNFLGKFLTIGGGLLKGSRHPIGGIGATIFELVKGIKGIRKYGLMGWLGKMMTVGEEATEGKEAIDTVTKTAPKMGKFASGLSSIFKGWGQVATMVGGTALVGWGSFKAFKSMFKDLKEMTDIAKSIDWDTGSAVLVAMGGFFGGFAKLSSMMGKMKGSLSVLKGGAILGGLSLIFTGSFWADMKLIKGGFKSIKQAMDYLSDTVKTLNELDSVENVGTLKTKLKNTVTLFNQLTDIMQIERNTPMGESTGNLKELDKKSSKTIKNIASAIKSMKSAVDDLNGINGTTLNTDNLLNVFGRLQHGLNMLGTVFENMPTVFKDNTASGWASKMSGTVGNFKKAMSGLVGENGIISMIPQMVHGVEGLDQTGALLNLPSKMKKLGQALTDVYTSLQGIGAGEYFASNIDSFRAGIKSLKFAMKHLAEISSMELDTGGIKGKIDGAITALKDAFGSAKAGELTAQITAFVFSIKSALQVLKDMNEEIEVNVTVKLSDGFGRSVDNVIEKIKKGKDRIRKQKKGINITIPVNVTFSVSTNLGSALAKIKSGMQTLANAGRGQHPITPHISTGGQLSRNGVLYRSGGGSIFKPRGTDKIPAMLTQGEYVHKKQAVDFFGVDFMRKVNAMDVRGAMDALLTKAGTAVGVGRQSIVNNTVNNNQRITQNINTNNPNFASARMGRFVGAL